MIALLTRNKNVKLASRKKISEIERCTSVQLIISSLSLQTFIYAVTAELQIIAQDLQNKT